MTDVSMTSSAQSVANKIKFNAFANLLEKISKIDEAKNLPGKLEEKKRLLSKFIEYWRNEAKDDANKANDNFYPAMRLLLPNDDRRVYGLKEAKLANYLIDVLCISKTGIDGKKLLNYRAPQNVKSDGDFASVAYFVLKSRCKENVTLSVEEVNTHLDIISMNNAKGKEGQKEINKSIMHLLVNLSALQLKWLIRIILKDLKIGIKENGILDAFHVDAYDLYNCTSSLENVCKSLNDPNKRLHEISVQLFSPCRPMLGEKAKPNKIEQLFNGREFFIETKYDGERFQVHRDGEKYMYYSRNSHDYTDVFGANRYCGKLTQYIDSFFKSNVRNFVIDGEMCAYSVADKTLLTKGGTYDVKSLVSTSEQDSDIQICFFVFDVLLFNDEVLTNKPLKDRVAYLRKIFNECEGRLQISQQQIAHTNQEVVEVLNKAIDNRLEGIVIKDPESVYKPSQRSGSGWYKVKPDYMLGLNDDLDLLVLGGYYGTGRRSGLLSHFLLGVAVFDDQQKQLENDENAEVGFKEPALFYSFCKIGSGYTMKELSDFNRKLMNKWKPYDKKDPPKHLVCTYERPEVWIEPKDSFIVQVKAVEIVQSDKYKTGFTLRFPRLEKFRDDKSWQECMTFTELNDLNTKNEGKLASKHFDLGDYDDDDGEPAHKKKRTITRASRPVVSSRFKGVDVSNVEKIGDFFRDKEFCVIMGDENYDKSTLEKSIAEFNGTIVQNPGPNTFCVVTSKLIHKVNAYINKDLYNVVKASWLIKCIESKQSCPWTPFDMFHSTQETRKYFSKNFDSYGDNYTEPIDLKQLKSIFKNMSDVKIDKDLIHYKIAFIENKYFPDESKQYGLFRLCSFYFCKNERNIVSDFDFFKLKSKWYGATICEEIDDTTTHCVLEKDDFKKIDHMKRINRTREKKFHIISVDWLNDCIQNSRIFPELPYHL